MSMRWLRLTLRVIGFVFGAAFLLLSVAGVLLWPRNIGGFIRGQRYYWRELIAWLRKGWETSGSRAN